MNCNAHGLGGFSVATLNQAAMLNLVLNCKFEGAGIIRRQPADKPLFAYSQAAVRPLQLKSR